MKFREIDEQIAALLTEDGEILDVEAFDALQIERDRKIEGLANYVLDLQDDVEALKREKARIADLQRSTEGKIDRLKAFLVAVCQGQKFEGEKVKIGFRRSNAVEISNESEVIRWAQEGGHEDVLRYADPTVSKSVLKTYLELGLEVPGAAQVENISPIIR